jgi:predicted tellurium resistance membrane protein TerC
MDFDLSPLLTAEGIIALVTLTVLEIVLGIDNIVFISIISDRVEEGKQKLARRLGLALAMVTRVLLLLSISWIMSLTNTLFVVWEHTVSGRDLVLLLGGLFLLYKATTEIHDNVMGSPEGETSLRPHMSLAKGIVQILLLDVVFSLDSVITAVGMVDHISIMIIAVMIAVMIMLFSAEAISRFVNQHPTVKMLALSFLVMIGVSLLIEGGGGHVDKAYIYFAMGFSVLVEMLNLRVRKKQVVARPG